MRRRKSVVVLSFIVGLTVIINMGVAQNPCPYPCYPPPIGGGSSTPPFNPSGGGASSYPPGSPTTPGSSGNLPNYPSPPFDGGFYGPPPPPPDPIVPYFPFYYRKPPHQSPTVDQSTSSSIPFKSTALIILSLSSLAVMAFLGNSL